MIWVKIQVKLECGSRTVETYKMEIIITKHLILDVAAVLDPPLIMLVLNL